MKKVVIGMSGGVDSSAAAYLLKNDGADVTGVTQVVTDSFSAADGAKRLCGSMGIPHITLDLREEFRREVEEYFVSRYEAGETPNPCVVCNRQIKFPYLLHAAGEEIAATGHYARIVKCGSRYAVKKGVDFSKDQSYVLWQLTQEQLSRIVFPLGEYKKSEVREIAREANFPCADDAESQDICFIPDGDYKSFIERFRGRGTGRGKYFWKDGKYLGENEGQICFTPGQGSGLGIALGRKVFVVSKDAPSNSVVLGEREDVMKREVKARCIAFMAADDLSRPERLTAKIRYGRKETPASVFRSGDDEITALFDEPVFAPAAGQSLVCYDDDVIVCGGIIK